MSLSLVARVNAFGWLYGLPAYEAQAKQAEEMVIAPRESEGDPGNRHRGADQWLFVIAGTGSALVKTKRYKLVAGTLLFIPRGRR